MIQAHKKFGWCLAASLMLGLAGPAAAAELIPFRATDWKYRLGTAEASNPTDAWTARTFVETGWNSNVPLPIGYPSGDAGALEASIQTTLATSTNGGYNCVFLRKTFVVNDPLEITSLLLQIQYDDGYAAWLNGNFVSAAGIATPYTIGTLASDHEVTVGEGLSNPSTSFLVAGANVLAIQVFNSGLGSSDLFLDARLTSTGDESPTLLNVEPPPQGIVLSLGNISVTFSEAVSGVSANDLLINGNPIATNLVTLSSREYTFEFPQPPTGAVTVAWAPSHGIADIDGNIQPFVAGPGWGYTLDPNAISAVAVISEFMADNENATYNGRSIQDEDGTAADWLELFNPGLADVSLNGWFLTDTSTNLTKWRIPNVVLAPNKYMVVWASEKNRTNSAAPLHTNFRLTRSATGYLALVNPQGNVISVFTGPTYPAQETDISYGRDRVDPNLTGFFVNPTPGAQNATSGSGFAVAPTLSLESGVYTNASLLMTITVPPGTTVRYTTDGSSPTNNSILYTGPITLQNNTTLKVRAFPNSGSQFPSPVVSRSFVFLDSTTRDFNSNLPVLILSTEGRGMAESVASGFPRTKGSFFVFDTFRGRSAFARKPDYAGPADFEVFGQTSAGFAKRPYNIELQDAFGNDKSESILGLPAEADWKLRNPYSDKCLMNDFLAYEMFEQMGNYSCRRVFVEVFVDTGGGRLSYPGDYVGVEVFLEKIERDRNRVDIAELTPSHTNEPSITGGFIFKKDKASLGDLNFTAGGQGLKLHEPKPQSMRNTPSSVETSYPAGGYTPSASNQLNYLINYLNAFNNAMNAADWTTRTGTNHYSHYIDIDSFVDSHWIVEFPKQIDGYRISNFFRKDRNGKVRNAPIWDWNLAFGNAYYLDGGHTNQWYYTKLGAGDHIWLRRLVGASDLPNSGGDPDFIQKIVDRWGVLRTNVMHGERITNRIDEIGRLLAEAAGRNYSKYPILNDAGIWPNPDGNLNGEAAAGTGGTQQRTWDVDYVQPTYAAIISEMKKWTYGRYLWIDGQFPKAPALSVPEGNISAGTTLVMTAPAGTIYYTLDGSDPRSLRANGAVTNGALTYTGPVTLNSNARVFARARNGTSWSPPTMATYVVQTPRIVITEIMYNPLAPTSGTNVDSDFEYVELRNVSPGSINLNGYSIGGGIEFMFPNVNLASGARILVVNNLNAFTNRYGTSLNIAGEFTGNLANEGNRLILEGRFREPILDFSYDDQWYPITDGFGFSLVIVDDNAAANTWGLKTSWRPSGVLNGTPGQGDGAAPNIPRVVINEALTHSDPQPPSDTIEFLNLSGSSASIAGWYLTDDFRTPKKYRIPLSTPTIPAGGFILLDEDDFNAGGNGFAFSSSGDEIYLFSADALGNLSGYHHGFQFGAQRNGVTFGRHVTSLGDEHFVALTAPTLGSPNAPLLIGPVVISEIMYRPQDVFANGAYWNNTEDEYIELRNVTGSPVNLWNALRPTNTWKLDNAVEFKFPTNTTIAANGYVLVVNFNPATDTAQLNAFRAKYGVSVSTPIFGPYSGNLANGDERVTLYLPDNIETVGPDAGQIPWVVVDSVRYSDQAPWPVAADGIGHSLHRVSLSAYADDVVNWAAAGPTPANGYTPGSAPTITVNPANQTVVGTTTATFTVGASGPGPIKYQWLFNDQPIGGATNATLSIPNVGADDAGVYKAFALNSFGSAVSSAATLRVLIPARITLHPASTSKMEGTNVTFAVLAESGNPPIRYQWRRNGLIIPGATNNTYSIASVQEEDDGAIFQATVTDEIGSIDSQTAQLTVLILPAIVDPVPWMTLNVTDSETVTLGAKIRGTKPIHIRWRRFNHGSLSGGNLLTDQTNNGNYTFITIPRNPTNQPGMYCLLMTNVVGGSHSTPGIRTNALVFINPDSNLNGIPDYWESAYFGSTNGASRDLDSDGDTMTNWEEYIAGTNPTNATSYLKVGPVQGGNGATVSFQALGGKSYTVLYNDSVDAGTWTRLGDVPGRSTDWIATLQDATANTNRFYRLVTPRQP